jgi:diguanylate cyclase (GGDEF)-like protein
MVKIKQLLMYAGLDKEEFDELLPEALYENGQYLATYSSMTTLLFTLCLAASLLAGGKLEVNRPIYIIMIIVSFGLYLGSRFILPRYHKLSTVLAFIFIISMYVYSFSVSLLHDDMGGVAAVAILLVMPALFNYRPIIMVLLTIGAQIVYCLMSAFVKEPAIALLDLWNCLFFGTIAVMLSVFQMRVKFRLFLQKRENRYLSETDLLTGAKNRNCYESIRKRYVDTCKKDLSCLFVDANGLHELNNSKGHEEGDLMLKTVSQSLIRLFGQSNTFRFGGDEFVVFCVDTPALIMEERVATVVEEVSDAGYSVSVGLARQKKHELDMTLLIREAEKNMYFEKRKYYEEASHEHRKRRVNQAEAISV